MLLGADSPSCLILDLCTQPPATHSAPVKQTWVPQPQSLHTEQGQTLAEPPPLPLSPELKRAPGPWGSMWGCSGPLGAAGARQQTHAQDESQVPAAPLSHPTALMEQSYHLSSDADEQMSLQPPT